MLMAYYKVYSPDWGEGYNAPISYVAHANTMHLLVWTPGMRGMQCSHE